MLFHVIGLKCQECGSYNTCRTADRDEEGATGDAGPSTHTQNQEPESTQNEPESGGASNNQ